MEYDKLNYEELIKILKEKDENIEKLKEEIVYLHQESAIDCMTGVLNRKAGLDKLEKCLHIMKSKLTICFMDVDQLKAVNDKYGHNEGDKLLVNVCNIIKRCIRKTDFLFRIGGDEFVAVFPNAGKKEAMDIFKRIKETLKEKNKTLQYPYKIWVSYGFSEAHKLKDVCVENLLNDADREMYKWKLK